MDSVPEQIEVPASILENSCGVALDIGGSVAKIVYRCNKLYKDGKLIDKTKESHDVGYLKVVVFPRPAVDTYIQYIADHADLTGDPPQVNSCGFGAFYYKDDIEKKLKVQLNLLSEFQCFGSVLLGVIKNSASTVTYYDLDTQGVEEGKTDSLRFLHVQYKLCDGLPVPAPSHFEAEVTKAIDCVKRMMEEDVRLPCLVVMCGSAIISFVLHESGKVDYQDASFLGGRSFQGLAFLLTGERDWSAIEKTLESHDGSTAYNFREVRQDATSAQEGEDTYGFSMRMRCYPFGNVDRVPRDTIKDGDLLYALLDTVCTNIGTMAYNTALVQNIHQVLLCGTLCNSPQARTIITRAIMWRNIHAHYKNNMDQLVDFRFVTNGGHLGALGALMNTDTQ